MSQGPNYPERPGAPLPLQDDLPTDLNIGPAAPQAPMPEAMGGGEEPPTEIPAARGGRILDYDEEEETQLGRSASSDVTELEVQHAVTLGMLWVTDGKRKGRFYPIRHGTVIGRKEGDLILDDPKVSGSHAKFTLEDDEFVLWDFGSANGTYVNGKKIREATVLSENDLIKIGDTTFVVKLLEPKQPEGKSPAKRPSGKAARSTKA